MIRLIFPEEVDDVFDLYMSYAPERIEEMGISMEEYNKQHRRFREQLLKETIIVYETLGEIIAAIGLTIVHKTDFSYGVIKFLCVKKERANRLYGYRLMQAMENYFRAEGCSSFITSPFKEQKMWHRMLKKYGFTEYSQNGRRVHFRKELRDVCTV